MNDFYFAYFADGGKVNRLYRLKNMEFERFNFGKQNWIPSPEQACILIGEDWDYEEISEEEAMKLTKEIRY